MCPFLAACHQSLPIIWTKDPSSAGSVASLFPEGTVSICLAYYLIGELQSHVKLIH